MRAAPAQYVDFSSALGGPSALEANYSQAEVDAIRHAAFAEGRAAGEKAALAAAAQADAARDAEMQTLVHDLTRLAADFENSLGKGLDGLEAVVRAAIADVLPRATNAVAADRISAAIKHAAGAIALPAVKVHTSQVTSERLGLTGDQMPDRFSLVLTEELGDGVVRLAWKDGCASLTAAEAVGSVISALDDFLNLAPANRSASE